MKIRPVLFVSMILIFGLAGLIYGQDKSPKRGLCGDASPQDLAVFAPSISWYYDWGVGPPAISQGQLSGIEWVPMCWGAVDQADIADIEARISDSAKFLLGFNEPNFKSQANITPDQAAAMWPILEKIADDKGLELVSPAVNWCGDCVEGVTSDPTDWLDKFFSACPLCKVDYIAIHNYAPYSAALKSYIQKFRKYNKPLWITEFAPWDPPKPDYNGVVQYMKETIPILENDTSVFRYTWFATRVNSNPDINLLGAYGKLTKLGQLYAGMAFQGLDHDIPPVAIAGMDISISLPSTAVSLKGSVYDANGDIMAIAWTQISGPDTATFSDTTVVMPIVSDLIKGTYVFRITVTANGETDFDEVSVSVGSANIALNKPITTSSLESTSYPATAANDGNLSTRWSSSFSDPQWIEIDLQNTYELTGARIIWETAAAKNYQIQVSNDKVNWTSVYSTTSGNGGTDNFTFTATARYIRMYSTARTTIYGNSIYEFEVWGTLVETGLADIYSGQSFRIYPNPVTDGIINISFTGYQKEEDAVLTVTNISGQLIFSQQIHISEGNAGNISIGTNGILEPGLYILSVIGKDTARYSRFIIN
jgi:hypothetical protein